ncbi:TolC family outer membrane protein [Mesobacterium pallidum]|uniref:TolC family outer membrane protein n=1 Tax=Mesobacterium pallidum TaxID=2872037 RepID=UPI001EE36E37|nr:TolC family outer membrane protein [Mesobacterium pallidum]
MPFGKRVLGLVTASALAIGAGMAATAETLADAMASAYNHSGLLEQNRALLRAADEDVAIAIAALRPILNWTGSVSRSFGTSQSANSLGQSVVTRSATNEIDLGLTAELLLYDFGATQFGIDAAKESVLATREALVSVEQQVLLRAVTAFMNVRSAYEIVALRENNLRLITQELRAARDRFEVGEVTRTDVAQAEAALAASRAQLAAAQGDLAVAAEEYAAVTGNKPGGLVPPSRVPATSDNVDAAKALGVRNHPEMKRAQHEVAAADLAIMRAEAQMKPTVSMTGRLAMSRDIDDPFYTNSGSVGIQAGGPIYQGGRLSALLRQAIARRDATRGGLHVTRHQVAQNVGNAWAQLLVARSARDAATRQIAAAQVAFRGTREEATLGARTTLDVLNAEQELLSARSTLITASADEYIAAYTLLSAMGLLTTDRLGLNVQRYDPAQYYNLVKDAPTISRQGKDLDRVLKALGKD